MSEPERVEFAPLTVYRVPKRCSECRHEWEGNSFRPAPRDGSRVAGLCDDCIEQAEAARKALLTPQREVVAEIAPTKPRKTFGYDD